MPRWTQHFIALTVLSLIAIPCQGEGWAALGPKTVQIVDLVAASDKIYAAADQSLFVGNQTGEQWTFLRESPIILNLAVHPDRPDRLFATGDNDLLRSVDSGRTWETLTHDIFLPFALDVKIDPANPDRIWRVTNPFSEAWLSLDGGDTWDLRASGLQHARGARKIIPAASNPKHLYILAYTGVFATLDEGAGWQARGPISSDELLDALVVDPFDSQKIYVATTDGVRRSVDGGRTWILPQGPSFAADGAMQLDPEDNNTLYAATSSGLYRSSDSGVSWTQILEQPVKAFTIQGSGTTRSLYAGGEGVFRSGDGGSTWVRADQAKDSLLAGLTNDLLIDPSNPDVIFAGLDHGGGLYRSLDGGATWNRSFYRDRTVIIHHIALVPGTETVYIAWRSNAYSNGTFLHVSHDLGETWSQRSGGDSFATRSVRHIAVHPLEPKTLYISNGFGIFVSHDSGGTWSRTSGSDFSFFTVFDPKDPDTLIAGGYRGELFRTTDAGEFWALSYATDSQAHIRDLAFSPHDSRIVLASYEDRDAIRSTDGGLTWTDIPSSAAWQEFVFDPDRPDLVYVTSETGAIHVSRNGGESWQLFDTGPGYPGNALALDPVDSHVLYVGTRGGSVHKKDFVDTVECPQTSEKALCLSQDRFKVEARWADLVGGSGSSRPLPSQSPNSGLFWFFGPDNYELMVKVLDGCRINNRYWVFAAATTKVAFDLFVTDMVTGERRRYSNSSGIAAPPVTDTAAFESCF